MGKKSKLKKVSSPEKIITHINLKYVDERDPLHEGRSFAKRRSGMWIAFNMANKICNESEIEEQVGIVGENL